MYELFNYLLALLTQGKLKPPANSPKTEFAYHRPCHLHASATIALLRKLCGAKVTDLKAGCCGLAGTFGMQKKNYDLSSEISKTLKTALGAASIRNVLTECAACKMQIEHISDRVVTHPAKIFAACY